jgi:hypothetical protein
MKISSGTENARRLTKYVGHHLTAETRPCRENYSIAMAREGRRTGTSASFDYLQAWPTGLG